MIMSIAISNFREMIQEDLCMQYDELSKQGEKKVSIIVPIYNSEQYLTKCLDTLVRQTLPDIEIILINDASTDTSPLIMDEYQKKYPQLIVQIHQEKNAGQGAARNMGLRMANGKYILFVDSDDYVDVDICKKLYLQAEATSSDIVCCEYYETNASSTREISPYSTQVMGELDYKKRKVLISVHAVGPCAKLVRRQLLIENELFFPLKIKYEDLATIPLWWVIATFISEVKEPLYTYVRHENSTTIRKNSRHYYDIFKAALYIYKRFTDLGLQKCYQECMDNILIRAFIDEVKFIVENVDQPDEAELQTLIDNVRKYIPDYEENPILYLRCDPKAYMAAHILMLDKAQFAEKLIEGTIKAIKSEYFTCYRMHLIKIQNLLNFCIKRKYQIAIWGAGKKGRDFLRVFDPDAITIHYIIDQNQKLWNQKLDTGHVVRKFEDISNNVDIVFVMNRVYFGGIYREVKKIKGVHIVNLDMYCMFGGEDIKNFIE